MAPAERFTALVRASRTRCKRIERRLPHARPRLHQVYERVVLDHLAAGPARVLDLGAGRHSVVASHADDATTVVGADLSATELAANPDLEVAVVADAAAGLPFADRSVDLVVSRSVLEHVAGVDRALAEVRRVLAPGAHTIHLFPSRWAPFAVLNRVLPAGAARWLLHTFVPGSDDRLGFAVHYERCTAAGMEAALRRAGLEVVTTRVSYYQADYFAFAVPLYLLVVGYELLVRALGLRGLAATVLVVARRPPAG